MMVRNRYCGYGTSDLCSASDDLDELSTQINRYIRHKQGHPAFTDGELRDQLLRYLQAKRRQPHAVLRPNMTQEKPKDWTKEAEEIWGDWVANTFVSWEWNEAIFAPIFGTDVRTWEIGDWRSELWHFLPYWVARSWDVVDAHDPCGGIPDESSDDEDER